MRRSFGFAIAAFTSAVLALSGVSAVAAERDDWVNKRDQAANESSDLEEQIAGLDDDLKEMYRKLEDVRKDLPVAKDELDKAQAQYASAQRELEQVTDRLNVAKEDKARIDEEIAKAGSQSTQSRQGISLMVREVYRSGDFTASPLMIAMTSKSTADITRRAAGAETMAVAQSRALLAAQDSLAVERNRSARQEALTDRIGKLQAKAENAERIASESKTLAETKLGELQSLEQKEAKRADDVSKVREEAKRQLAASEREYEVARQNIARIDEENRRKQLEWQQNQTPPPATGGGVQTSGVLSYPLGQRYPLASPFGYRWHPVYQTWRLHEGTDIAAPCGTPALATANGVVSLVTWSPTGGNYLSLNYGLIGGNSYQTYYLHLQSAAVSVGQTVSRGQVVGYVGSTGASTGCHLHYEVVLNGTNVDPANYL
ncbi:peptidoglycan DD-metalloendopeptidase family protein [Actinomyces urinae]|uniref:peptidoglycan DD-metalloendopeptidase family protein n=1 Tax=Actinomyces urinae TaxID=1689268 RepID=UPI0009316F0E|nr:M23 family metallopeptidase [Actinomyces urinae]